MELAADIAYILERSRDNGAEFWATPDGNLIKGGPFSTLEAACLRGTGFNRVASGARRGGLACLAGAARGRALLRSSEEQPFPCHTILAARDVCTLGFAADARLERTLTHLLETQHEGGGWRCNKFFFGHGPETEAANPGPTLTALDVFRQTPYLNIDHRLDLAVEFLLAHWVTRAPLGPCHYGIGTLFRQVTFPFSNYNLFYYVYVLSFYDLAKRERDSDALSTLQGKLKDGQIVVERPHAKLAKLSFCSKESASQRLSGIARFLARSVFLKCGEQIRRVDFLPI